MPLMKAVNKNKLSVLNKWRKTHGSEKITGITKTKGGKAIKYKTTISQALKEPDDAKLAKKKIAKGKTNTPKKRARRTTNAETPPTAETRKSKDEEGDTKETKNTGKTVMKKPASKKDEADVSRYDRRKFWEPARART